jgi:hypothetical protein
MTMSGWGKCNKKGNAMKKAAAHDRDRKEMMSIHAAAHG